MIKSLSKETVNKIAAGEVVERPLNVVKELCENAIDAGATAISVEIRDGGKTLIRVTDNGVGIAPDECEIAFLRHTTSKISDSDDLYNLKSLGFRGEALSSIAAVSKVELITKKADEMFAKSIEIHGGEIISNKDIAAPNGSTFFVRDLFYNTPARLKFLKSNQMENSAITESFEKLALSRPDISFKLTLEGKEKLYTSGRGNLKNTIFEIYDLNTANSLLDIRDSCDSFELRGFIGKGSLCRGNRGFESFFVNGRYIKSRVLEEAVESGFSGFLMQHGFPFCVLNLSFPKGSIDVNIHPSKMEVRFDNQDEIKILLEEMVRNRLSQREDIEEVKLEIKPLQNQEVDIEILSDTNDSSGEILPENNKSKGYSPEPFESQKREEVIEEVTEKIIINNLSEKTEALGKIEAEQISLPFLSEEAKKEHRIIGQVFDTYWLIEYDGKFYVIDQHAAHEKVLFERMMKSIESNSMTTQGLFPPMVITLTPTEEAVLLENIKAFNEVGFSLEHFGGHDYQITGVPGALPQIDPAELFRDILKAGTLGSGIKVTEKVASMACKAAVKGNYRMSIQEIDALVNELMTLDNPYHCPHGRPTMISFSRYELDKKFKRIV